MSLLSPSLEAFWAVVQKSTVQDAAKILGLTQTGVTQRIRGLEKQLGVTLFTRSRKGMRLTTEGESLLRYVTAARDLEGETLSQLHGTSKEQQLIEICISGTSTLMRSRIIPRVSQMMNKHPQLRVRFDLTDTESIIGKLKTGFSQIVAVPSHQVGLELDSKVLAPEKYYLVGPSAWKKRSLPEILNSEVMIDFDPQDTMTIDLLKKNKLLKQVSPTRHYANNIDAMTSMIEAGVGYSSLTAEFAEPFIRNGTLIYLDKEKFLDYSVALAWYPRAEMPNYFKDIIQSILNKTH